jgi:hypothetical protein
MLHRLAVHNEVGHAKVHIGRQSAIELDLAAAVFEPSTAIPEVQKVKVNGLVNLVDLEPRCASLLPALVKSLVSLAPSFTFPRSLAGLSPNLRQSMFTQMGSVNSMNVGNRYWGIQSSE